MRTPAGILIAILLLGTFFVASLKFLPMPWLWPILVTSAFFLAQVRIQKKRIVRLICWNLGAALLVVGIAEAWLTAVEVLRPGEETRVKCNELYRFRKDPLYGYALEPSTNWRAIKTFDTETVYDVACTVDVHGLRVSPPVRAGCTNSALFFGCSFTYGEGVNDDETMPYRVGILTDGNCATYNFGVPGYGPQHMLALIESGRVKAVVGEPPRHAIYQALYPDHAGRGSGKRDYLQSGPQYEIGVGGVAVRRASPGALACRDPVRMWLGWQVSKSALGRKVLAIVPPITRADKDLFVAIVKTSAAKLRQQYPDIQFHVLVWTGDKTILRRLADAGLDAHDVSVPLASADRVTIHATDGHPPAKAHDLIARYVVEKIMRYDGKKGS